MKTTTIHFCVILVLLGTIELFSQGCANQANIYTFTYNGKTYKIIKEQKTWAQAALCAVEMGGYLVEINDMNEQEAIYDEIITGAGISPNYTSVQDGGGVAYVWIGGTDQSIEGTWWWDGNNDGNGTSFWIGEGAAGAGEGHAVSGAYANWGGTSTGTCKEPDNYGGLQDAAAIGLRGWPGGTGSLGIPGEWNDINMANTLYFVVEKNNTSGLNNKNTSDPVRFYPNPVKDELTIKTNHEGNTIKTATVYDLSGNEVMNHEVQSKNTCTLHLGHLAAGTYEVKVKLTNREEVRSRVVVL